MKILVTGSNGYIGTGIVNQLLDGGHSVVATDFSTEHVSEKAEKIEKDIFSVEHPYEFFGYPDVVLHLAWKDGFEHNSLSHMENLPYHYLFLKRLLDGGLKHLAVLGSMHEVGFYEGSVNETTPTNPQSLYGICKNALRQSIELECKKHKAILQWIRGYYIVGNTTAGCSIFSKIVQAAERGEKSFPFTMGVNQYDFIDYNEFCADVVDIIVQENVTGIVNCCSGMPMRLGERVEKFIQENGYDIRLQYGAFPDRPYDSKAIWGNREKLDVILKCNGDKNV